MEKNINNGLIGLNKYVLMKMIEVIAIDECNKAKEEIDFGPIYVKLPETIKNILGVCSELYSIKNHKYFREYIRLFNNNDSEFIADVLHKYEEEDIKILIVEL
jgi:hypothetical protein